MASVARVSREASAREVSNALLVHQQLVAAGVVEVLKGYLPPEQHASIPALMAALGAVLNDAAEKMIVADVDHAAELADDAPHRAARDQAKATLRETLVALKDGLNSMDPQSLGRFGLDITIPDHPQALLSLGNDVLGYLEDKTVAWPKPLRKGLILNRPDFVNYLRAEVPPLKAALDEVAREKREAEGTLKAKDLALAHYDQVFSKVANLGWALFRLAGEDKLADRIKPSPRRPGRTAANDEEPEPAE